ncbi:ABC transporter permease [Thermococcus sp.]
MNWGRILTVSRKVFWELRHDRRLLVYALVTPVVLMVLFGLAFGGHVQDVKIIVVNEDNGHMAADIIKNFDRGTFVIEENMNIKNAIESLKNGECWAVIYFPKNFTENIFHGKSSIKVYLDRSNINIAETVMSGVNRALIKTLAENGARLPVRVQYTAVYGREAKFMDTFLPGVVSLAVFLISTILSVLSFIGERNMGALDRALATPLREEEIVTGYSLAFGIVGVIQALIMLIIGIFGFNVRIAGNPVLAFFIVSLLAVVGVNLGMLLSNTAKSEAQAVQFVPMVVVPTFLLSGIFWPVEAIPKYLRPFSYILPPTYAVDALRSVIIRGWGIEKVWHDVAVLIFFGILFLGLAIFNMKKKL